MRRSTLDFCLGGQIPKPNPQILEQEEVFSLWSDLEQVAGKMDILADDQTFEEMGSQDVEVRGQICRSGRLLFGGIWGGRCGVAVLMRCGVPRFGLTLPSGTVLN